MKGCLKGSDGIIYSLAPKVTTVGREGCDIVLQTPGVDQQHAVIEYSEQEDCFVIQDLNTAQGTYVNDVRVQNATVRLAPSDLIRFGYGGMPFELLIDNPPPEKSYNTTASTKEAYYDHYHKSDSKFCVGTILPEISYPPVQHRPAWTQPLTMITDTSSQAVYMANQQTPHAAYMANQQSSYMANQQSSQTLPYLATGTTTITIPAAVWTTSQNGTQLPRPPTLRSRPLSAGSTRRVQGAYDRFQPVANPAMATSPQRTIAGAWMAGTPTRTTMSPQVMPSSGQQDIMLIQEKEQKIMQLQDEVSRLRALEIDGFRKDQQVQQMQQKILELETRLSQQPPLVMGHDVEITQKLVQLENEITAKNQEIAMLREQQGQAPPDNSEAPSFVKDELLQKVKELNNVKNELERIKKDKNITSGLVTQMQRDMSSKDSTISKLTREIETLKKELREKDSQISSMSAKVTRLKESTGVNRAAEERDAREKELISLRQKFKTTENKIQEQNEVINSLKQELDKFKLSIYEEKDIQKKLQTDCDQAKAESQDYQRAERLVRVELEQATKRLERFRNRVIQVTFSTPGIRAPETEINDDELLDQLKKIIEERTEFFQKVKDLREQLKLADTNSADFRKVMAKLRMDLEQIVTHLQEKGFLVSDLKQELGMLQSVITEESGSWMKECLINILTSILSWEQEIENSLEKCGVNIKLSSDGPGKHINLLFVKWESAISEKERLLSQIMQLETQHKIDLEMQIKLQKDDTENRIADAVERARLEGEEKLNQAIDGIRAVETEKRENAIDAERKRQEELQETIEQLRLSLLEKQDSDKDKLEAAAGVITELEQYKALEVTLREDITQIQKLKDEEISKLTIELSEKDSKYESEMEAFKEQNKQHSVTICAMEERIVKVMKKNTDYQEEITSLKKVIQDLKIALQNKPEPKPAPPPKPKVIVQKPSQDVQAMEQLIVVLRNESGELKKRLQDQDDMILGLRRDLAGAHARLSDITGELSETQKQEIERNKELLNRREQELGEIRQQMAKLTKIIDKQKEEIKSLEIQLSKEKEISIKYKRHIDEKLETIKSLETQLSDEKEEQKRQLDLIDNEGRITSELTALGAQCRGERHEQVIMRQREALAELRTRVKNLEVAKPPLPTKDQALQQVIMLKKELAEMRANQALSEDTNIASITSLDREVSRARGLMGSANAEADMERSAHRETMDALECSENSFMALLQTMSSSLELEEVEGLRPIGHIPRDERERLLRERETACQILANRVKVMKERLARKDELLQGYERDLAKMRQAQELAERKASQVENLADDLKNRSEETQYLRESLNRTRDRLDQERRLNTAIKQRKTFHLENEKLHLQPSPSHHCQPEDIMGKAAAKKRAQKELSKRKNYEIKTLKNELTDKERSLFEAENRLYTMENSLSMERKAEVSE